MNECLIRMRKIPMNVIISRFPCVAPCVAVFLSAHAQSAEAEAEFELDSEVDSASHHTHAHAHSLSHSHAQPYYLYPSTAISSHSYLDTVSAPVVIRGAAGTGLSPLNTAAWHYATTPQVICTRECL